jgi:hypothetical protein
MKLKLNSVACVRERTIPTERPPFVVEVSANLNGHILGFLDRSRYFSSKLLLSCTHEAEWTPTSLKHCTHMGYTKPRGISSLF